MLTNSIVNKLSVLSEFSRYCHWVVVGDNFLSLHNLFSEAYVTADTLRDKLVETSILSSSTSIRDRYDLNPINSISAIHAYLNSLNERDESNLKLVLFIIGDIISEINYDADDSSDHIDKITKVMMDEIILELSRLRYKLVSTTLK